MSLDSMKTLFTNELKDVLNAERQLVQALPKMARAAESQELQNAFTDHLKETEGHVIRLEKIFGLIGETARGKKCKGMEGLLEEGKEIMEEGGEGSVVDAALISAAQRVEHYEIAAYGCLRSYADLLGLDEAVALLDETLAEEEAADEKLSSLAEGGINESALSVGQGAKK
ncbi:MAG TPA: ferritin-like domain-containing protein [Gemmatimonadales bacterium]